MTENERLGDAFPLEQDYYLGKRAVVGSTMLADQVGTITSSHKCCGDSYPDVVFKLPEFGNWGPVSSRYITLVDE